MDGDTGMLMISALQHYAYCRRQFALIHVEQAWSENYFTAHGQQLHDRVDNREPEQRGDLRYERGVAVCCRELGLSGRLDLLEITNSEPVRYCPVEYKRGKPKVEDWDRIQLCAQALCLEKMRGIDITEGAIWYWSSRQRVSVLIDDPLRETTLNAVKAARAILLSGQTPVPIDNKKRCRACSLLELCQPATFRHDRSKKYIGEIFKE